MKVEYKEIEGNDEEIEVHVSYESDEEIEETAYEWVKMMDYMSEVYCADIKTAEDLITIIDRLVQMLPKEVRDAIEVKEDEEHKNIA